MPADWPNLPNMWERSYKILKIKKKGRTLFSLINLINFI